jgi:hypothetical protein
MQVLGRCFFGPARPAPSQKKPKIKAAKKIVFFASRDAAMPQVCGN